jgi:ParB family chromosome partitioning protein
LHEEGCLVQQIVVKFAESSAIFEQLLGGKMEIGFDLILPSPYQPRTKFDVEELKEEIKKDGLLNELIVRRLGNLYELLDGERRVRAVKDLGWKSAPARVVEVDDKTARRWVYKVNKIRSNYSAEEEARYFKGLADEGLSAWQIGEELNTDPKWVQTYLDIFILPVDIQNFIWSGKLTPSHVYEVRPLLRETPNNSITLLRRAAEEGWSRDQIRRIVGERAARAEAIRQEAAKHEASQILPEVPDMETLEGLKQGIKALQKEARKKQKEAMTPEETAAELQEKQHMAEEKRQREEEQKRRIEERVRQETLNQAFSNPELLKIAMERAETILPANEVRATVNYPTTLSDKHLAAVFKAPPETWTDLIKASEKCGWTPLELTAVVDIIKDENAPSGYKAQLLRGEAEPVVREGGKLSILADTLGRRTEEALGQDKVVALSEAWDALGRLELFDCKDVIDALDAFHLERVVKDTPRDVDYLNCLLNLARERLEFYEEVGQ